MWRRLAIYGCCRRCHRIWVGVAVLSLLCAPLVLATSRPEIGARALGLSGAFISNADDSTGSFWNPAALASLPRGSFVYDLSQGAFAVGYPIHPRIGTLGFSLLDLNRDDRFFIEHPNNPIGTFERGHNQVLLSYARSLGAGWQIGGNIGYSRAPYTGSKWKRSYDLGIIVRTSPHLTLGARMLDISGVQIPDEDAEILETFDQQFALGATWKPIPHFQWNSALDTTLRRFKTGAEVDVHGVAFRLGSAIDLRNGNQAPDWSFGVSINRWDKQIDYAYSAQPDLEHKHFVSVGFTFGSSPKIDSRQSKLTSQSTTDHWNGAAPLTEQIAKQYGVELELLLAMIRVESNFQPDAISSSGAVGLTQLMPPTARELGLKVPDYENPRKPTQHPQTDERFQPRKNLEAGVQYLSMMLERYDGNYVLAVAAYNAGPGRVQKNVPLIRQTEQHVGKVLNHYYQYKANPALKDTLLQKLDAMLVKGR